jgi:hypothetical protein
VTASAKRGAVGVVALSLLAAWAVARVEPVAPGEPHIRATLAAAVAAAFPLGALVAGGPLATRLLFGSVGAAWALASWAPRTDLLHQGVLILALLAFPAGRIRGRMRWALAALAAPVALLWVSQPGVAAIFVGVSLVSATRVRVDRAAGLYPMVAAAGIAVTIGGSWAASLLATATYDPPAWLLGYELVLLAIATGYPLGAHDVSADRARLADVLLDHEAAAGLDALSQAIARALHDPGLVILRGDSGSGPDRAEPPPDPDALESDRGVRRFAVVDEGHTIAVVRHRSNAFDDPATAQAVIRAVRLVVRNEQARDELDRQVLELRAARARVTAATDRERALMAARLRLEVVDPLRHLAGLLGSSALQEDDPDAGEAVTVAAHEVARSIVRIESLVAGLPPTQLGDGRLGEALAEMAGGLAVPVEVLIDPSATATADVESALFFVAGEALANVDKHAEATCVRLELRCEGGALALRVVDDGRGGADPAGSGLRGLADRLAVVGGRLEVDSPADGGTCLVASVPSG